MDCTAHTLPAYAQTTRRLPEKTVIAIIWDNNHNGENYRSRPSAS